MNKAYLISAFLILHLLGKTFLLHAQPCVHGTYSSSTAWDRRGNTNANTTGDKLGFKSNYPLYIVTNSVIRMTANDANGTSTFGYIGIGDDFCSPLSRLHMDEQGSGLANYLQITNVITNNNSSSVGFQIGYPANSGIAEIHQWYSADLKFYVNGNNERMRIDQNGNVGIGNISPQQMLSVNNGVNIDQSNTNSGSVANALTFGSSSGEGIASARTGATNVNGFDIYTGSTNRIAVTNGGNVGIGLTAPQSLLHQHAPLGNFTYHQFTNTTNTGSGVSDGFKIGINGTGEGELRQLESLAINFLTANAQRMTIRGTNNSPYAGTGLDNTGYVGIGTISPSSPLTVFSDLSGTGQIIPGSNWGNGIMIANHGTLIFDGDRGNVPANRDFFMAHPSIAGPQGDFWEGLVPGLTGVGVQYVYRLYGQSRAGAPVQGVHEFLTTVLADVRVGVNTLFPSQRVESVDPTNQQLRLTQTQNTANGALGTWTDFQTTLNPASVASLYIHPSSDAVSAGTAVNGFVGINDATPSNTLEITSTAGVSPQPSGLRLTNLTSGSASAGTFAKFLTVNSSGDVILGDQTGSGGGVTACAGGLSATNYITKITNTNEICKTAGIWEDPSGANNVGIGTTTPVNKLQVNGDINVSSVTNAYRAQGFKILGLAPASSSSTLVGRDAGGVDDNTTLHAPDGTDHTIVGYQAGYNLPYPLLGTPTTYNTFIGRSAGYLVGNGGISSGQGQANTLIGAYCAQNITTGSGNTALGFHSGSSDNSYGAGTGNYNSSVGYEALTFNTSGDNNAGIGKWALWNSRTGSENVGIGNSAGAGNYTGSNNTFIGSNSNCSSSALTYATAIGAGASVSASSTIVLGRNSDQVVIGGTAPNTGKALEVWGDATKNTGGNTWATWSDMQLKRDTVTFSDGLNVIDQLNPIKFRYKNYAFLDSVSSQIGIIAQSVLNIAPYTLDTAMVELDTINHLRTPALLFNSNGIFWAMVNAIKELHGMNQQLTNQMNLLQTRLDVCCSVVVPGPGGKGINPNTQSIELINSESVILKLGDAVPNPFAEHTTISYTLPEEIKQAQIIFYESSGKVLRTVDISARGNGELIVYAPDLSSGIY